jgi:hypothetical protein
MAAVEDIKRAEVRLHMFTYYGTLMWQVFAIFVAAATLLATIPFLVPEQRIPLGILAFGYFAFNEIYAGLFLLVGIGFLLRNRELAHMWIHWQNEEYIHSVQFWIDIIEQGKPNLKDRKPKFSVLTGKHYLALGAVLASTYILISAVFLFVQ